MLVGKNSAIKGFTWFLVTILKLVVSIATIAYIEEYTFIGIVGIIALIFFAWEQVREYKRLEKESNEAMDMRNRNR